MNPLLLLLLFFFFGPIAMAQNDSSSMTSMPTASTADTVNNGFKTRLSDFSGKQNFIVVGYENISVVSNGRPQSLLQKTILELESSECEALKKHDMATLQRLWARDFTLDTTPNKVVENKNSLPRYISIGRLIEVVSEISSTMICTSGIEQYQELRSDLEPMLPVKRKFFHTWMMQNGIWKLATKRHEVN